MSAESKKRAAAEAALIHVPDNEVLGVGTGSTVNFFIDALAARKVPIKGAVSSSASSTARLERHGIEVLDLNAVGDFDVYVDGADESDPQLHLIKGGGASTIPSSCRSSAASLCRWKSFRWRARTSPASWCGSAATPSIAKAS
jgi:ribose 5-phosphate isomerase